MTRVLKSESLGGVPVTANVHVFYRRNHPLSACNASDRLP